MDGCGKEIVFVTMKIDIRVEPDRQSELITQLQHGVSYYLSQMIKVKGDDYR